MIELNNQYFNEQKLIEVLDTPAKLVIFSRAMQLDHNGFRRLVKAMGYNGVAEIMARWGHSSSLQSYVVSNDFISEPTQMSFILDDDDELKESDRANLLAEILSLASVKVIDKIEDLCRLLAHQLVTNAGEAQTRLGFQFIQQYADAHKRVKPTYGLGIQRVVEGGTLDNLVILDVSGSMGTSTVNAITDEVIALAEEADATLAIVSNNCYYWLPGTATASAVRNAAEYRGTHYEELVKLLDEKDWGTVITIADYDSSLSAKQTIAAQVTTRVQQVLDISLVERPTFLSECVGQLCLNPVEQVSLAPCDLTKG